MNNSRSFASKSCVALSTAAAMVVLLMTSLVFVAPTNAATTTTQSTAKAKPIASAKPTIGGNRPTIQGGQGGPSDEGSAADVARHAAMQKYQDCLTATGVTLPSFGGFGGGGFRNGTRPTGAPSPRPSNFPTSRPTLTAEQQSALDKCAPLRPAFGRGGGTDDRNGAVNPSAGTVIKKSAAPVATKKPTTSAKSGASTAVKASTISCLNAAGINVKSASDIASLDKQSPKIAAALKKCASSK